MSTGMYLPTVAPPVAPLSRIDPQPKRWTCEEFHDLGDRGVFEHARVMLIDGEILVSPMSNPPHATASSLIEEFVRPIFAKGFVVRIEKSLVLSQTTDPVPDVAVVSGSIRDYALAHPTTAVFVIEISDTSLDYDTNDKASLYASAGIADYWVVDLVNRQLIVHRNPQVDASKPFGFTYANVTVHLPGQNVAPLAAPNSSARVDDLLP